LIKYDKFYCKGILEILPKKKYYYYSHHHTSSYKKRRARKIKMIIGGLFILLLTMGTIYFKILPLFSAKQSSDTIPASEEIMKPVAAEEEEKGLDMLAQEISPKENMEEEKEEEKGITIDGCLKGIPFTNF
jgi:hypothetical protein